MRLALLFAFAVTLIAHATEQSPSDIIKRENDKKQYWLLNPVPETKMREFITDRPDRTESPYSVDAGHFQMETDLAVYTQDGAKDGTVTRTLTLNLMNLKVGLTRHSDLQLVVPTFVIKHSEGPSGTSSRSGYGDTTVRLKYNIFGNDGGPTALGVMPYVTIPTAGKGLGADHTEGGIIVPFALELVDDWNAGFMMQADFRRDELADRYHVEWISSLTIGHDLPFGFEFYTEFYSQSSAEAGAEWVATFDAGLVRPIGEHLRLDAGVNIGVTEAADDWNPFIGFSLRF